MVCAILLLTVQLFGEYSQRYSFVFWEPEIEELNVRITDGVEKGVLTSKAQAEVYRKREMDAQVIRTESGVRDLLVLSSNGPEMYLNAEKEIAAFSAWLSGINEYTMQRLERYYQQNPKKIPDGVYLAEGLEEYGEPFLAVGYQRKELPSGALLLQKEE